MGEGMETMANKHIAIFMRDGGWLILNNCHLAIPYMAEMEDIMNPKGKEIHDNFRIWLTTESVPDFPLGLLQLAIKVGYEPPKGI
jgi:dynein heavy chain